MYLKSSKLFCCEEEAHGITRDQDMFSIFIAGYWAIFKGSMSSVVGKKWGCLYR